MRDRTDDVIPSADIESEIVFLKCRHEKVFRTPQVQSVPEPRDHSDPGPVTKWYHLDDLGSSLS